MANRFWVGASLGWDSNAGTKWATTSGGAGGASVPTSADDVFFDANSGAGTPTIDNGNTDCLSLNCTGFTGTLGGTATYLKVYGSLTLVSGMGLTYTGQFRMFATSTGMTVTTAGKTLQGDLTFEGVGGGWTLQDNLTTINTKKVQLLAGTLSLGATTVTTGSFTSGGGATPTLNAGTSTINIQDGNGSLLTSGDTGFTFNIVNCTGVVNSGLPNIIDVHGSSTFTTLSITKNVNLLVDVGTTQTVTNFLAVGTLGNFIVIRGNNGVFRLSKSSGIVQCDFLKLKACSAVGGATWFAGDNSLEESPTISGTWNSGWIFPVRSGSFL